MIAQIGLGSYSYCFSMELTRGVMNLRYMSFSVGEGCDFSFICQDVFYLGYTLLCSAF